MKGVLEILSGDWTNAFGWMLLHSLWQSFLVLFITTTCLRFISPMKSGPRYAVACAGFLLMIITSACTLIYLQSSRNDLPNAVATSYVVNVSTNTSDVFLSSDLLPSIARTIEPALPFLVGIWGLGFAFYTLRLSGGLLHTYRLRATALPLEGDWATFLTKSAGMLGVRQLVSVAESASINAPMVIGYFKPVILLPLGMVSGLTTEQLETIFLHELAHIRRHDYLINVIQSIFETVFFFNPFVRILSNEIRKEREHCCDDVVVRHHGGSKAYAHALARLAELKLSASGFALALADDKNQLLNRIKRIMERSTNASGKGRIMIPLVLLLAGLLCISWLGSGRTDVIDNLQMNSYSDTVPKKENGARYSRRSIITLDENGQPHEQIVEEFEGDESLRPLLQLHAPPNPHVNMMPPGAPDTIPPSPPVFGHRDWREFSESLEQELKKSFEQFYGHMNRDSAFFPMELDQLPFPDWDNFNIPEEALRSLEEFEHSNALRDLDKQMEKLRDLDIERFDDLGKEFDFHGNRMGRYEQVLRDELSKDGYLSEGESIQSLQWNNDSFKVNDKKIREEHEKKYKDLNEKFFGHNPDGGKVE